jgi:hypothetical protein
MTVIGFVTSPRYSLFLFCYIVFLLFQVIQSTALYFMYATDFSIENSAVAVTHLCKFCVHFKYPDAQQILAAT